MKSLISLDDPMETPAWKFLRSLPKMSQLLVSALGDLMLVEQSSDYIVNMGSWHSPVTVGSLGKEAYPLKLADAPPDKPVCMVCLGGARLSVTDGIDPSEYTYPEQLFQRGAIDGDEWGKLNALDSLRCGDLEEAYATYVNSLYYNNPSEAPSILFSENGNPNIEDKRWRIEREFGVLYRQTRLPSNFPLCSYDSDPTAFKTTLFQVAVDLSSYNL